MRHWIWIGMMLWAASPAWAAGVKVLFEPGDPQIGPFPTDYLTAPSTTTRTAKRVRLPQPADCAARPNACEEAWLASRLDGFHIQARVNVRFSGAVQVESLKEGMYLVAADSFAKDEKGVHKAGEVVKLNRFVYDPRTNTAYAKPDGPMDQARRYVLVVTDGVKDTGGDAVEADGAFTACNADGDEYCKSLAGVLKDVSGAKVVGASVFTTMSVTGWMEAARDALENTVPVVSRPAGESYFALNEIVGVTVRRQVRAQGGAMEETPLPVNLLGGSVSGVAFGSYSSPNYLGENRRIEGDAATPVSVEQVGFNVLLPRAEKPEKGYPVVIFGHGLGDSRLGGPLAAALGSGGRGAAVIAISAVGHGNGPESTFAIRKADGTVVEVPTPGRGVDVNRDGRIEDGEGCADVASSPLGLRDCLRQTVIDLLQLTRLIRSGLDVDGDGVADLDPEKIYYAGMSLGGIYGTMYLALEPGITRGFLNAAGGPVVDVARWSKGYRAQTVQTLGLRRPGLLNRGADFDESYVLRNEGVKVVTTAGALEIQNALEMMEWLQAEGDPAGYAVHLKTSVLKGVKEKAVLWQFGLGDQTVPNNTQTALVRYAGMKETAWVYRHDMVRRVSVTLGPDPHIFLVNILPAAIFVTQAAQGQMVSFLLEQPYDPNAGISFFYGNVFEQPGELPEGLNFLEP